MTFILSIKIIDKKNINFSLLIRGADLRKNYFFLKLSTFEFKINLLRKISFLFYNSREK